MENDARISQENPDPLARCPGSPWSTYYVFDALARKCIPFARLGGGTGVAYFEGGGDYDVTGVHGPYFSFRPYDGKILDLWAATFGPENITAVVEPDGTILTQLPDGTTVNQRVFPAYDPATLLNVDDITLIKDRIYGVQWTGSYARIAVLVHGKLGWDLKTVCDLGNKGWSQGYVGIGALSWSQVIDPTIPVTAGNERIATFFLKTDNGDFLSARVFQKSGTFDPDANCAVVKLGSFISGNGPTNRFQAVEYKRTLGFDRTADSKPYFLY